ncbi:restriction endonuclease subunit S [Bacillus toyonensis]
MKSNYKRLGPYIRLVDVRNTEDKKDNLLGVSVSKVFIKSIANTVGTDFTKYKVVKKKQFTYIPDTSRRGDKIGIALLENEEEAIVSQAYTVFEVLDTESLLPEYLMMWFRRPEFDRYARFISHGSVREIFSWEDMCDVELPIPSITKQKEIVNEYNVLVDRINLNNQLIQKLEETVQAIYKQWFIDYEYSDEKGGTTLNNYIETNPRLSLKKNELATYVEMKDLTTSSMGIMGFIKENLPVALNFKIMTHC